MARVEPVTTGYEWSYVPARLIDRYRQLVSGVERTGKAALQAQLAAGHQTTEAAVKALVNVTMRGADSELSEIDRQYYETARASVTGQEWTVGKVVDETWNDEVERAIDAMMREYGEYDPLVGMYVIRDDEYDRFESDLEQFFTRMVNDRSKHYVEQYGRKDYMQPRYARVPSGLETCAYCYAIAGLGFQYRSAESAKRHSHANCDCAIVPSWGGSYVEGYDSEVYADMFRNARSWLNSSDAPDELRRRVSEDSRERGYTRGWNGVLAAMRKKYDLK